MFISSYMYIEKLQNFKIDGINLYETCKIFFKVILKKNKGFKKISKKLVFLLDTSYLTRF